MKFHHNYFLLLFFLLLTLPAHAARVNATAANPIDIPDEEAINLAPWLSYNQIIALEKKNPENSQNILLLLRKAHAENILYFFEDFAKTAAFIADVIDSNAPVKYQAKSKLFLAISLYRNTKYEEAIELFEQSIALAKSVNDYRITVTAKLELAHTLSLIERFETSLTDLQEAYLKAYTMDDQYLIAQINEAYGAIYGYMGEYEKSAEYHQKAIGTFKNLGFRAHLADSIYGLASTYRYWGKYDLAIENYEYYGDLISYTPNTDVSFYSAYGLGMSYAENKMCVKALPHIERALNLNGLIDYNAELYKRKASCMIQLNRLNEAQVALEAAEKIFKGLPEIKGTQWDIETKKVRAFLYQAQGEYLRSFQLLNEYYDQLIALMRSNSSERIVRVRAAMDLERKNIEYVLLEQRNKVQSLLVEQQLQKNLQQGYIIAFGVVAIFVIGFVLLVQYRSKKQILALSVKDSLSGLYNRRYIFDYIDKTFASQSSDKSTLTLIMLDIDDFKQINDSYGHPFGDKVIVSVANACSEILRYEDVMARIGGEEFLCVLPRIDAAQSIIIANRMLEKIAAMTFQTEQGETISVTVSIGIATSSAKYDNRERLYHQVDSALYASKHSGKNRVTFVDETTENSQAVPES